MRKFYTLFSKSQTVSDQLTWSHYTNLIILNDIEKINYYIDICIKYNLSCRELRTKIKNNEYKIKIGDRYNYIDLLLYNIEFNCYVVIELKITELKKEHIGQIQTYMNYIDKNIKQINQSKTIGIVICKKNNKFIMEYCSDERIITREYELINHSIFN